MTSKRFVIGDVLGFGWRVMASNLWFFVGLALVAGLLKMAPNWFNQAIGHLPAPAIAIALISLIAAVVGWFISIIVNIGFIKISLRFCDGRKPPFGTLFDFQGCFWRYVGASVLQSLIVFAASPLFIIPLVFWLVSGEEAFLLPVVVIGFFLFLVLAAFLSIKYGLCLYFVIDKGLRPVQALKASSRTTMGIKWKLFGFGLLCGLIILLGLLCLVVGVFAAYPIVLVANALVYRHLMAQTPELAEFNIDPAYLAAAQQGTVT